MVTYRVISYDAQGQVMRDFTADVAEEDGPPFIAHHVLHADGVVCCEILDASGELALRKCDPGVDFDEVVKR